MSEIDDGKTGPSTGPKLTVVKEGEGGPEPAPPPTNLLHLPVITRLNTDPDLVLESAKGGLESVVIVGYEKGPDGNFYFASSVADAGTAAWLLQRGIWQLNQMCDELDGENDGADK